MPEGKDTAAFPGKGPFHGGEKITGGLFVKVEPGVSDKTGKVEPGRKARQKYKPGTYPGFCGFYGGKGPDNRRCKRLFHTLFLLYYIPIIGGR
jgi:hypothetical protein